MTYYKTVNYIELDIKSIKRYISSCTYERAKLVNMQAPKKSPKSMDFSEEYIAPKGGFHPSDARTIARIEMISMMITEYEKILYEKEFALRELKDQGYALIKKLKRANKSYSTLEIFIATHIEGKSNDDVKKMGYAAQTIYNAHTEVNKHLQMS